MTFILPDIQATLWGPSSSSIPTKYQGIPYAPFSKSDKLGRAADWYESDVIDTKGKRRNDRNVASGEGYQSFGSGVSTAFSYVEEESEANFSLVDRGSANAASRLASNFKKAPSSATWLARNTRAASGSNMKVLKGSAGKSKVTKPGSRFQEKVVKPKDASISVSSTWKLIEEYQLNAFNKLHSEAKDPIDLYTCGSLPCYDRTFDRTSGKNEKPIAVLSEITSLPAMNQDPIIKKMIDSKKLTDSNVMEGDYVFASEQVAALLMTSNRSINGWDIIVTKRGGVERIEEGSGKIRTLFFEKREKGCVDYIVANETSAETPTEVLGDKDHFNSPLALALEAALVNQSFAEQAIEKDKKFPFGKSSEHQVGLKYRLFDLGEGTTGDVRLVIRGHVDACSPSSTKTNQPSFALHAVNECFPFDASTGTITPNYVDWRSKIDTSRGAVLATEIRNNNWKLARWTVEALLVGIEQMKLGFVSRVSQNNPSKGHSVLGIQNIFPKEFSEQISVDMSQGWGIIKSFSDILMRLPDGQYVIFKDPNEPKVRLYNVPKEETISGFA